MTASTPLPLWTLSAPFWAVDTEYANGRLSDRTWIAYQAVWLYSAPRFSDEAHAIGPAVREINAQLDTVHGPVPACLTCHDTGEFILGPECGNLAGCMAICGDCAPETVGERGVW